MRKLMRPARFILYATLLAPGLLTAQDTGSTSCTQSDMDEYRTDVSNHVFDNWVPPFEYRRLSCTILLTQNFRSEVDYVEILKCDSEISVRKSAEKAGYESSPLPQPRNRACFSKQLSVRLLFSP
jgi:hypothetical protein